jgi:hypothetical protein
LLVFDYAGLKGPEGLLEESELWNAGFETQVDRDEKTFVEVPAPLRSCKPELREELLRTLLDVLRRSLAVKVDVLDPQKQLDLVEQTKPRLLEDTVWYLEDARELVKSVVAYPRPRQRDDKTGFFVSSYGGYGRYLKRSLAPHVPSAQNFGRPEVDQVIRFLLLALKRYGIVEQVRSGEVPGYQINADALRWLPADGRIRPVDRTRLLDAGEIPPDVNNYFVECYRSFVDLKCVLEAREHTAQLTSEDREEREDRFRSGDLPLLFCSPTMELGVDIAQLNLVNLRNVPPTPANYAQRSGRAGRGGQPALVYTYCAGRSPHDQYYFREPNQMVAGFVAPPRIDIRNRDLVRSHVHAVWMEVATPDLGTTWTTVLNLASPDGKLPLPVKDTLAKELRSPSQRAAALAKANFLIASIRDGLTTATWFHENWTREILDQIERAFDAACERWRGLYRAAVRQREIHHKIIGDHSRPEAERNQSRRLRAQAESQIRLLTEAEGIYEGDFFIVKQLPVLPPTTYAQPCAWAGQKQTLKDWLLPRVLELTYTAWDLEAFAQDCGWSGPPFRWDEERRFLLRCELDAAFFHLCLPCDANGEWRMARKAGSCPHDETPEQLAELKKSFPTPRDAVSFIMDTFPIVKRKDEEKFHGDYRTKRTILEIYDALAEAMKTGQPYQTRLNPPPADPKCCHPPRQAL